MSRNEGGEEEKLFVWVVLLSLKVAFLRRITVVREGISLVEDRVTGNTLQSDDMGIAERSTVIPFSSE